MYGLREMGSSFEYVKLIFYVVHRLLRDRYVVFQQLADKCIMALKMEVRCQCYYYITILLQKVSQAGWACA